MGLNSGEVVVGTIGDDLRMDYTAQGHVVGVAARLQALADPGKAYVSETTAALVEGFFELESLGAFRLKGVTEPLRVFSLEGVGRMRTRLDVSRARGLSRFVGRLDEMAVLQAALADRLRRPKDDISKISGWSFTRRLALMKRAAAKPWCESSRSGAPAEHRRSARKSSDPPQAADGGSDIREEVCEEEGARPSRKREVRRYTLGDGRMCCF